MFNQNAPEKEVLDKKVSGLFCFIINTIFINITRMTTSISSKAFLKLYERYMENQREKNITNQPKQY